MWVMSQSAFQISPDDLTLTRARRGDRGAQAAIYKLYADACWTLALRLTACPDAARDVVQESFIRAFGKLQQFRGESPFGTWLRRIVANQAISLLRRRPDWTDRMPEQSVVVRHEDNLDLAGAFARLKPADRTVVWLFDVEGYSHEEIAELTGSTALATRSRLSRARAQLREWLSQPAVGVPSRVASVAKDSTIAPRHFAAKAAPTGSR